jgi:hypothetical protein
MKQGEPHWGLQDGLVCDVLLLPTINSKYKHSSPARNIFLHKQTRMTSLRCCDFDCWNHVVALPAEYSIQHSLRSRHVKSSSTVMVLQIKLVT